MAEPTKAQLYEILEEEKKKFAEAEKVRLEQLERIQTLEQQLTLSEDELIQLKSVQGVIKCVNELTPEEKKLLAHEVRTTKEGVAAFKAINHGNSGGLKDDQEYMEEVPPKKMTKKV
jgi:histidinol dehydrogenase